MKSKKKVFVTVLCAAALVVASVLGTMAYLTSKTADVTNTFTVGNVAITLDEAKTNENGDGTLVEGAARVTANNYKVIPGHTYTKDPIIHVTEGSENSYVFVKVTNDLAGAEATTVEGGYQNIHDQIIANGWTELDGVAGVYYKANVNALKAAIDLPVFQQFKAKDDLTKDNIGQFNNKTIVVTGYAIQADGFDTALAAWNAVKDVQ